MIKPNAETIINADTLTARVRRAAHELANLSIEDGQRQRRYLEIAQDMQVTLRLSGDSELKVSAALFDFCGLLEMVLGLLDLAAVDSSAKRSTPSPHL